MYDSSGNRLTGQTNDLDTDVAGLTHYAGSAAELGALSLTHLGWSDYTGDGGDVPTVWNVDSLTYFDTATGAANAAAATVPEPTTLAGASLLGLMGLARRARR